MKIFIAKTVLSLFVLTAYLNVSAQNKKTPITNKSSNGTTIKMGTQEWMKKNLDIVHYRNGDPIPQVQDPKEWSKLTTGAWCYYENSESNGNIYGKLYNWYAINDPRGLAPEGYHIPSEDEFRTLIRYLNDKIIPISYLQSTQYWKTNTGINKTGFNALPSGMRSDQGDFMFLNLFAYWWSRNEDSNTYPKGVEKGATYFYIEDEGSYLQQNSLNKKHGYSVRCIKD